VQGPNLFKVALGHPAVESFAFKNQLFYRQP